MRKTLLALMAATTIASGLAPVAASAQPRFEPTRELHQDRREIRQDREEIRRDIARGDYREAREDRRELREDRREYREDWREYRRAHADRFRGPAYAGPRGYAYRPVNPGYRFAPDYYNRRYWVDPMAYRLPRVGVNERWVRYGHDVVRIDIRSGRVLQVYSSFFF
ncbi:hypothetical protein GTZ99_04760 [Novosphingobium sp. FSY-8]|uniref:Ni/Co efflux regulator RcnB n=1 Tax=Novosphingobium ovatum TaxID=1908523 RepID=A0ABW9XBF4_9SPHN|nr:RcnB family protein [Novosphingobium ovatum]NBC35864.1 hypothetical protein [Novosphingobium ovatum]